jgi:Transcriptional regulators
MSDDVTSEGRTPPLTTQIMQLIMERGLSEGEKVPTEAELSLAFGTSRQKIREALRHLEGLGVLHARQGSGRVLTQHSGLSLPALLSAEVPRTPDEILNFLTVRQVLEVGFLSAVVAVISADELQELRDMTAVMEAHARDKRPFAEEDRAFHQSLYAPLGNPLLLSLIGRFWDLFIQFDEEELRHAENAMQVVQHHVNILDAIEKRDAALAQFHMNSHFYDVVKIVEEAVEARSARSESGKS